MDLQKEIVDWLKTLKGWQTELAFKILTKKITEDDLSDLVKMVKSNSGFSNKEFPNFLNTENQTQTRLLALEAVENIENLAPRNPLKFDKDKNLTVIFGSNGTGKTGYTKIIKKISGKPQAKALKPNVFNPQENGKCVVKYSIDNKENEIEWSINDAHVSDLGTIDVFDTTTGNNYIEEANTTTYTPNFIKLFKALSHYYSIIQSKLETERNGLVKTLPTILNEFALTEKAKQYNSLNKGQTQEILERNFSWDAENEKIRLELEKRLKEKDPTKTASDIRKQKFEVDKVIKEISAAFEAVNNEALDKIKALKVDSIGKRKISQQSAIAIADKSNLNGVGSSVWKALWEAARSFSIQEAYKNEEYPNVSNDSKCVLCHQPLDKDAQERLKSFETFVKSTLEKEAVDAEKKYSDRINALPERLQKEILATKCAAANLNEDWLNCLDNIWEQIKTRANSIKSSTETAIDDKFILDNIKILKSIAQDYEKSAEQFDKDAKQFDRNKASKELLELNAQKWCFNQLDQIYKEVGRLIKVAEFDKWISQCNTRAITSKSSQISETAITEEYVKRFNSELSALNAKKIKVELVKEKAVKGTITHSLRLKGIDGYKPSEVLSEGEHRIIALAAFLADVTGGNNNNPFVFDDPISSLDQRFEEKTVERLLELSKTRQVIIFTHRLSLLGQLNEKCESKSINIIGIRKENWGAGEIGTTPLFAKKTIPALNKLKDERLARAKKIYTELGSEEYYPLGKALCSDLRIIVERIVEIDFLADVIQRYRRSVNTKGKVGKLVKIKKEDCDIIDDYMTKYSSFEHSQPDESPVEIPEPEELENDIKALLDWLSEFNNRKN